MKSGYKRLSIPAVLDKTEEECEKDKMPVVVWKRDRERATVHMYFEDFMRLLTEETNLGQG